MSLSINQVRACQLIAKGRKDKEVWPLVGVSETTYYRWKRLKGFEDCLSLFQKEELERVTAIASAVSEADELEQSRADEAEIREQVKKLAINTCMMANALIQKVIDADCEELSPRMIPGLVKAATDAVTCLRDGNDRLTGLEGLLDELGQIEKQISAKGLEFLKAQKGEAA